MGKGSSRRCIVPSCRFLNGRKEGQQKRAMFQIPKDETKARKWAANIPGITSPFKSSQTLCESHFELRFILRYQDKKTLLVRSRLSNDAVPTIFDENDSPHQNRIPAVFPNNSSHEQPNNDNYHIPPYSDKHHTSNVEISRTSLSDYHVGDLEISNAYLGDNRDTRNLEVSSTVLVNNIHNQQAQPSSSETSLKDIVQDLSTSEKLLMDIKQEFFPIPEEGGVKLENPEDGNVKAETNFDMMELTAYEQLHKNFSYYVTQLPENWNLTRLPVGTDQLFALSKERTISENEALMVMNEKSIVLDKSGNVHYSIHGKMLNIDSAYTPSTIKDIDSLLNIILQFDNLKICQGICTNEFEVDKEYIVYKDDLNYSRHVSCSLIADQQQCDSCWEYSQYLSAVVVNNVPVLGNGPVRFHNQIY